MQDHPQENLSTGTAEKPGFPAAYVTFIPFPSQTARDRVPRILIVEDEVFIALMIEEMVREIGYEVSGTVHNIAMARQEFAKKNFDAVLLDISVGGRRDQKPQTFIEGWRPFAFVTGYDYLVEPRHEKILCSRSHSYPCKFSACWKSWSVLHHRSRKRSGADRDQRPQRLTNRSPQVSVMSALPAKAAISVAFGIIATPLTPP